MWFAWGRGGSFPGTAPLLSDFTYDLSLSSGGGHPLLLWTLRGTEAVGCK